MFGNNLAHGTDLMLVNADNTDDIFHMIEIIKGASISTGINNNSPKQPIDANYVFLSSEMSHFSAMPGSGRPSAVTRHKPSKSEVAMRMESSLQ